MQQLDKERKIKLFKHKIQKERNIDFYNKKLYNKEEIYFIKNIKMNKGYYWPIGSGNKPNILSNDLDQAPKNTNSRYQARLDAMSQEIEQTFNRLYFSGDKAIENWLSEHQNDISLHKLNTLKPGESIAFEIKREKVEEIRGGWNEAPSMPKGIEDSEYNKCKHKLSKNHETLLQAGEKWIFIIIKKEFNEKFPKNKDFKISAIEFQIPWENTLLPKGFIFEKELKGEEFLQAVTNNNL